MSRKITNPVRHIMKHYPDEYERAKIVSKLWKEELAERRAAGVSPYEGSVVQAITDRYRKTMMD